MGVLQLFAYQLEDGSGSVRFVIGCGERQQATDACDCGENQQAIGAGTHYSDPTPPCSEVVVATSRLETMLGDVAVAVHPEDRPDMINLERRQDMFDFENDVGLRPASQ